MKCWALAKRSTGTLVRLALLAALSTGGVATCAADQPAAGESNLESWQAAYSLDSLIWLPYRHEFGLGADLLNQAGMLPSIRLTSPGVDEEWLEGSVATIEYETTGPIAKVRIYYYGGNCPRGGRSGGSFGEVIADMVPNTGRYHWKLPWIDATSFRLRIAGYSEHNERLGEYERTVRFRPRELADLHENCIAVIKRKQRLYYYKDGRIVRMHVVSTGVYRGSTPNMHPGSYSRRRGAMGQVFRKSRAAWSRAYTCWMPYFLAITSSGSHGIHATSRNLYRYLGRPASHGCIRQHRSDAKILYDLVSVGTPVYVF